MLRLENICKDFGEFKLDNVSLEIKKGYIMGLIGHNGSGKTSIIKIIMNLLNADEGKIYYKDKEVVNYKDFKKDIGFVYDELYFYEDLKVKDFIKIVSSFYDEFDDNKCDAYLEKFNIDKKRYIKDLSKGESIKLSLAKALSHNAKLLILDEPTSGLDPIFRKELLSIIQQEMESGDMSVLISTHIISDLENSADYITLIKEGKVVLSESMEYIKDNYKVIKSNKETLDKMDIDFIKRKDNKYYSEAIFKKYGYEKIEDATIATIEDIMNYMGR